MRISSIIIFFQCLSVFVVVESFTFPGRQQEQSKSRSLTNLPHDSSNNIQPSRLHRKRSSKTSSTQFATGTHKADEVEESPSPASSSMSTESIKRNIDKEFLSIAFPAFLQQVAVPLADLIDATFLRKLDPSALGGMGVARASQAAVSKLYNTPLSKT